MLPDPAPRTPAAVLFDMDGLLVDTEHVWFEVETALVTELGGHWGRADQELLVGGPLDRTVAHIVATVPGQVKHIDISRRLVAGMVAHLRAGPITWMPGARELLTEVSAAGVPRALVSSSLRIVVEVVLDSIGREHLPVTVTGDDVIRTKPHPDPYLLAARTLGVDPAMCVALEDSAIGATAARAAGCLTLVVPSVAGVPEGTADHVLATLTDIDLAGLGRLLAERD